MVEGTNDENKIMMKKADGANIEVISHKKVNEYLKNTILFSSSKYYFAQPKSN